MKRSLIILGNIFLAAALLGLSSCNSLALVAPAEPVTIKFRYLENQNDYPALAEKFHEKYPSITVETSPIEMRFNFSVQEELPNTDVVRVRVSFLDEETSAMLLEVETFLQDDPKFPRADYLAGTLEGLQQEGKQVGLPAGIAPFVVFYEPKKFEAAGLSLPSVEQGWTLDEFLAAAAAINNPTPDPTFGLVTYGFCSTPESNDPMILSYLFGGGIVDQLNDPTLPTFNTVENADALRWYSDLSNIYGLLPPERDFRSIYGYITSSQCGLWMNWSDVAGYGLSGVNPAETLPLPTKAGNFSIADMDGYFISKFSLHPQESWKWIRFLADQQAASGQQIPPRHSQILSDEFATRAAPTTVTMARSIPDKITVLGLGVYRQQSMAGLLQLYREAAGQVIDGQADPMLVLEAAQAKAEMLLIANGTP